MKLLKTSLAIFLSAALLSACDANEKKEEKKTDEQTTAETATTENKTISNPATNLEGAWEIIRAEGPAVKSNLGTVYTFEGDNLTMGKNGFNNPGKTEITDSTFSFQANGNKFKFMFHYLFDGDTLVTSMENSNGQRLFMLKK